MTDVIRSPVADVAIACAITVHRMLGPGLLESTYAACLKYEFIKRGVRFDAEVALPVKYDDHVLDCGYRLDLVVEQVLLLEIKSVERLLPVHSAQILTYLKLSGLPQGLLLNFNVTRLRDGIKSFLNTQAR